jgi:hypothetical protein
MRKKNYFLRVDIHRLLQPGNYSENTEHITDTLNKKLGFLITHFSSAMVLREPKYNVQQEKFMLHDFAKNNFFRLQDNAQ